MTSEDWLDPDDTMGAWEYQLQPLTVGDLRVALRGLSDDVPVQVDFYDGTACRSLRPMHIDFKGVAGKPSAAVITVH